MYVYSVFLTINIDIVVEWQNFMTQKHLQDVMNTGCFESYNFLKVDEYHSENGVNFRVDYFAKSKEELDEYLNKYTEDLRQDVLNRFGGKFTAYRKIYHRINP